MTENGRHSDCPRCVGRLENPPEQWEGGFSELVWNLREYGYPLNKESVDILIDYVDNIDVNIEDVDYEIVAQVISQNYDIDFKTNNRVCDRHYLESQGVDTEELSDVGVQLVLEDFNNPEQI